LRFQRQTADLNVMGIVFLKKGQIYPFFVKAQTPEEKHVLLAGGFLKKNTMGFPLSLFNFACRQQEVCSKK
jgi:hypothetical protein